MKIFQTPSYDRFCLFEMERKSKDFRGMDDNVAYKNTVIKDKEAYNGAMLQHLLNPVEDLAQALKTPIKLAKGASISRQNNSVNIAEGQSIRVNGGHVLTVTAHSKNGWC